jgi:hypothetical protein
MNKFQCLKMLENNGDSVITIRGEEAIVATTDFSTQYIRNKRFIKLPKDKGVILVFSWTDDQFKAIDISKIKNIKPLSDILGNIRDAEEKQGWRFV